MDLRTEEEDLNRARRELDSLFVDAVKEFEKCLLYDFTALFKPIDPEFQHGYTFNQHKRKNGSLLEDPNAREGIQWQLYDDDMKNLNYVHRRLVDIEDMLSCYKNAGDRHWNLSSLLEEEYRFSRAESLLQSDLRRPFEEWSRNHFTALPGSRLLTSSVKKEKPMYTTGNWFSQLDNNESWIVLDVGLIEALDWRRGKMTSELHLSDRNMPIDPKFQHGYTFNQHNRKKIARRVSSFVVSTIVFLGIFFDIWSQLSIIQVQPLHKKHGPLSIWLPFLGLLGFMVFVCAVATMILVRAPFTRMQKAMLIFWGILMHLQSAKSISTALFVPLVGVLFMGSRMLLEKTITK